MIVFDSTIVKVRRDCDEPRAREQTTIQRATIRQIIRSCWFLMLGLISALMMIGCQAKMPDHTVAAYLDAIKAGELQLAMAQVEGGALPEGYETIQLGVIAFWNACTVTAAPTVMTTESSASVALTITRPDQQRLCSVLSLMCQADIYALSQQSVDNAAFARDANRTMVRRMERLDLSAIETQETTATLQLTRQEGKWRITKETEIVFSTLSTLTPTI